MSQSNMPDNNPYSSTGFSLDGPDHEVGGDLIADGQTISFDDTMSWLGKGFDLFKRSPGIWIAILLIWGILRYVIGLVPVLGPFANVLMAPIFTAGMMLGCIALENGQPLEIEHLFAGFKRNTGQLVTIGALALGYIVGVMIIAGILIAILLGGAALSGMLSGGAANLTSALMAEAGLGVLVIALVAILLMIPLSLATWQAPALVIFHDLEAIPAMKASFRGAVKNLLPLIAYGIIVTILMVVSMIPLFLGLLVMIPTMIAAQYFAYKRIFLAQ